MATGEGAASATASGTASAVATTARGAGAAAGATASGGGLTFRSFLSDINPLQYIPVVGAVYRAVTGDEGNATLRFVASLGTSFALGGPLGLGVTVAEKVTGIDPERIARSMLSRLLHHGPGTGPGAGPGAGLGAGPGTVSGTGSDAGLGTGTTAGAAAGTAAGNMADKATGTATGTAAPGPASAAAGAGAADRPWSAAELSAYAAATGGSIGTGASIGADALNAMELQRVSALYA